MCRGSLEAEDRYIESRSAEEHEMLMTPEPFLSAEISYRQQRVAEEYSQHARRRRHRVPRRRHLRVPEKRGGAVSVA
jgi:hypothetical protein